MRGIRLAAAALLWVAAPMPALTAPVRWVEGDVVHEYQVVAAPRVSWDDARAGARALGSGWDLATITSAAERDFVGGLPDLVSFGWQGCEFWLGARQIPPDTVDPDANWTWVTGEPWDFTYWTDREPNDNEGPAGEQYLTATSSEYAFLWNDAGTEFTDTIAGYLAERTMTLGVEVGIDIRPGAAVNVVNPGAAGVLKVAILSRAGWDVPGTVDERSLTFGRTGDERSLVSCLRPAQDVNGDGLPDLVCHFSTAAAAFSEGDTAGTLKGKMRNGVAFAGADYLETVPR